MANKKKPAVRTTVAQLCHRAGVSEEDADKLFDAMLEELDMAREVWIRQLGTFEPKRSTRSKIKSGLDDQEHDVKRKIQLRFRQSREASNYLNNLGKYES